MAQQRGKVYKKTTLVGSSPAGFDAAVQIAIARAEKTLRNVEWFEVIEQRGRIQGGTVEYQVTLEVGFALEEPSK